MTNRDADESGLDRVEVDGGALELRVRGDGPPLVLVHGSVFADPWEPMLEHADLLVDYQVVTYRRRGYGTSTAAQSGRTLRHEGADLVAVLDHVGADRAHAVGHSLAAGIVLQATIDAPDRFETVALLEPGMFTVPAAAGMSRALARITGVYQSGEHRQAMLLFLGGPNGAEVLARLEERLPTGAGARAMEDVAALFGLDLPAGSTWRLDEAAARSLRQPTLLALGSDTGPIYRETNAVLAAVLPNVEQVAVSGAGHFVHVEQPEQVARALASFLGRNA